MSDETVSVKMAAVAQQFASVMQESVETVRPLLERFAASAAIAEQKRIEDELLNPIPRWLGSDEACLLAAKRAVARLRVAGWCT